MLQDNTGSMTSDTLHHLPRRILYVPIQKRQVDKPFFGKETMNFLECLKGLFDVKMMLALFGKVENNTYNNTYNFYGNDIAGLKLAAELLSKPEVLELVNRLEKENQDEPTDVSRS